MGLLFNSQGTINVLQALNSRYGTNPATGSCLNTGDAALYDPTSANTLATIWAGFGIVLAPASANGHWNTWLLSMQNIDNGTEVVDKFIRRTMFTYLNIAATNANCVAIEFFAVPSMQVLAHSTPRIPVLGAAGKFSFAVTVETLTYDKAATFALESGRMLRHED